MTSIPTRKIEMSTEQKQDIHCGTCTVKGDMVACLATPCSVRSSWFANSQAAEIERLTGCLEKANIQAEKFEREWYLRGDENEALKAECETRKAYGDEQTEFAIKNANERDALKADAERYKWLKQRLLCADFSYGDPSEACNALVFEIPEDMRVSADLDSSIDAMKGKS